MKYCIETYFVRKLLNAKIKYTKNIFSDKHTKHESKKTETKLVENISSKPYFILKIF